MGGAGTVMAFHKQEAKGLTQAASHLALSDLRLYMK